MLCLKVTPRMLLTSQFAIMIMSAMMVLPVNAFSQDRIYKTDNSVIDAIIVNATDDQVDFRKFPDQNGPLYSVAGKDVSMIVYQNGDKKQYIHTSASYKPVALNTGETPMKFGPLSLSNARQLLLSEEINNAIGVYAMIWKKDTLNSSLTAEYAYALALGGLYDAALSRLDMIWNRKGEDQEADYFASEVFVLMGYNDLASAIGNSASKSSPPRWLSAKATYLNDKYRQRNTGKELTDMQYLRDEVKRANRLTAKNYFLESMALFEKITIAYPEEYIPYVGYSIALEKAGMTERSQEELKQALKVLGETPEEEQTRNVLEQRLLNLEAKSAASNSKKAASENYSTPHMLLYAGGQLSSSYSSMNGRFGLFMSKSSYATLDAGFTGFSGTSTATFGVSAYQRGKIMVLGMGLSASLTSGTSVLYYKVSMGPSIMNKTHTASWDIFLDGRTAITKGYTSTLGISVGRSVYFGRRK